MGLSLFSGILCAQEQPAEAPVLDELTRLEIQGRLNQFVDNMERIYDSCKAPLRISGDVQQADSYLKMLGSRLRGLEQNMKSMDVRWNNYYSLQQWEIGQDEGLMSSVERFELMRQEAADSLEVRKQMLQSLQDFSEAMSYMEGLDSTYNRLGKQAFELSLSSKTAPQLEKQKMKEQLLFATVQEKFDKAKVARDFHLVSDKRMEALEDVYAVLKNKSETIQAMKYKPLIQRIKDYLLGLAAVAVVLMFVNMLRARIKAAKEMRANMKKYKDTLNLGGKDDYPTI
jgi:hypothetical protein